MVKKYQVLKTIRRYNSHAYIWNTVDVQSLEKIHIDRPTWVIRKRQGDDIITLGRTLADVHRYFHIKTEMIIMRNNQRQQNTNF
jgi:hypothetical protein